MEEMKETLQPDGPFAPPGGSGTGVTAAETPNAPVRGVSGGGAVPGTDPFLLGFEKEGCLKKFYPKDKKDAYLWAKFL